MTKPIKAAESTPAATTGTRVPRAKKAAKPAAATPAKASADKPAMSGPAKPGVAMRSKKAAAEKKPSTRAAAAAAARYPGVSPEQRRRHVEIAAYFWAERHGFTPGREHEDWVAAEAEIDRMLDAGLLKP
jgi:hypothetical protein